MAFYCKTTNYKEEKEVLYTQKTLIYDNCRSNQKMSVAIHGRETHLRTIWGSTVSPNYTFMNPRVQMHTYTFAGKSSCCPLEDLGLSIFRSGIP